MVECQKLKKREIFRRCFAGFDYERIARFTREDIDNIMSTDGMIKSRRKIEAIVNNALVFMGIRREFGSFSDYIWSFTGGRSVVYIKHQRGQWEDHNALSDEISRDLKKRGSRFLGSVTVYSHLQASGVINDHEPECFMYKELCREGNARFIE